MYEWQEEEEEEEEQEQEEQEQEQEVEEKCENGWRDLRSQDCRASVLRWRCEEHSSSDHK